MESISIGGSLRAERLRQGKGLAAISHETKIDLSILEALENDQFERIPGGSYKRSFLRQYARALRLNDEEVMDEFRHQYVEEPLPLPVPPHVPRKQHSKAIACVLLGAGALMALYKISERGNWDRKFAGPAPLAVPAAAAPPAAEKAGVSKPPESTGTAARAADERPPLAPVRVAFTAAEPVWVSVRCDGNLSYTGTLTAREKKTFEAAKSVILLVGNAGGLIVTINDRQMGAVGAHGETQLIEFTPNGSHRLPHHSPPATPAVDTDPSL